MPQILAFSHPAMAAEELKTPCEDEMQRPTVYYSPKSHVKPKESVVPGRHARRATISFSISSPHDYFIMHELDPETGLYFYQAQYYNPTPGRLICPNAIVPSAQPLITATPYTRCPISCGGSVMRYRFLGSSGLLISRITLGTMTFGAADWGCDEREAHAIMKRFLDGGGNSIDAADVYAGGKAEEIIGGFLPQIPREEVVLASKCFFPMGTQPNRYGLSRKHIIASCESSLRRLRTEYIDLYYLHGPDPVTPLEETLRAFNDLVRQGKVRYIALSNLFAWQIAKAAGIAARLHLEPAIAGQYI